MADHDYLTGRLDRKYSVSKADGSVTDPKADYFVLRIDEDPFAREAAFKYAIGIFKVNKSFANDIVRQLTQYESGFKERWKSLTGVGGLSGKPIPPPLRMIKEGKTRNLPQPSKVQ